MKFIFLCTFVYITLCNIIKKLYCIYNNIQCNIQIYIPLYKNRLHLLPWMQASNSSQNTLKLNQIFQIADLGFSIYNQSLITIPTRSRAYLQKYWNLKLFKKFKIMLKFHQLMMYMKFLSDIVYDTPWVTICLKFFQTELIKNGSKNCEEEAEILVWEMLFPISLERKVSLQRMTKSDFRL